MKKILLSLGLTLTFCANAQLIPNKQLHISSSAYVLYNDTKIDNAGNIYAVGYAAAGADIDPGTGSFLTGASGSTFISKYNTNTQTLDWVVTYTTSGSFAGLKGIALNSNNDVFVTGLFNNSMDINPGAGSAFTTSYQASVLIKFTNSGNYVGYKEILSNNSGGYSISVDASDKIYVSGFADGNVNFDTGASNFTLVSQGNDLFIACYNPTMVFSWASLIGSPGSESPTGIDQIQFDNAGNVYMAAKSAGATTIAGTNLSANAECIIKTNSTGSITACWKYDITAPYGNKALKLQVFANGKFYVSGGFYGTVDFDPTAGVLNKTAYTPGTANDQFVGIYDANGSPVWFHTFSNYIGESFYSSAVDSKKNIYLFGNYDVATDYDKGTGVASFPYTSPVPEYMIVSYDSLGNYRYGKTFMNGIDPNYISKMKITQGDNGLLFMGNSSSSFGTTVDYAPGTPVLNINTIGNANGIVTLYDFCSSAFQSTVTPAICSGSTYTLPTGSVVSATGTYTSNLKSYWGCDSIIYTSLTVNSIPTISISPSSANVCFGNTINLNASGAGTYTWSTSSNSASVAVSPTISTIYSVSATDVNGCSNSATKLVNVLSLPTINVSTSNAIICTGETSTLTATGANTYLWNTTSSGSAIVVNPTTNTVYTVSGTDANGCSNSSTITQSVSLCTGITQLVNESSVSVFPNPFTDVITIKNTFKNSTIVIVDILGKVVFEKQIVSSETHIDLSELKTGFYQLMVNGESNSYTQKIIKQ